MIKLIAVAFTMLASTIFAYQTGVALGREQALAKAYKTNPPSQELEMVCLGLWMGEQNKKYWEKTK
jgi:hypothetical protein